MSGGRYLLLFLGDDAAPGWLRLEDGVVTARDRDGTPPAIDPERDEGTVVGVAPAADVTLHWVDLPALAPAQAAAAARLLAVDAAAEPLDRLHVAVEGSGNGAGLRAMAVTSAERMSAWLDRAAAIGLDPDHVVPESLLVESPEAGVRIVPRGRLDIVRGPALAFAAEPELAALALDGEATERLDAEAFEAGLGAVLAARPLDLRQGAFAKRRRWRIDWRLVRRLAMLGAGILAVTMLIQLALILRYAYAADALEAETQAVARRALPRAGTIANAPVQLAERLSALRGGGAGFAATAAATFAAVRDTPNVDLGNLRFDPDGSLLVGVLAGSMADITALQQRLTAAGFAVSATQPRPAGGRQIADLTVRTP